MGDPKRTSGSRHKAATATPTGGGGLILPEHFMEETNRKLQEISGQIYEMREEMSDQRRMVNEHNEDLMVINAERSSIKKWGFRMLIAIFIAALFSPHSSFFFAAIRKVFENQ